MKTSTFSASASGPEAAAQPGGKARWHAPVFKRLDVDLTAGNKRNSNDPGTRQNQFLFS